MCNEMHVYPEIDGSSSSTKAQKQIPNLKSETIRLLMVILVTGVSPLT